MGKAKSHVDQTIASELFTPNLTGEYAEEYSRLLTKIATALPHNRVEIIQKELKKVQIMNDEIDVDKTKYNAVLNVLIDLSKQGWIFDVQGENLLLSMENDNVDDKQVIRYRLSAERNAQFQSPSVSEFIKRLETERDYCGKTISIKSLIGSADLLIDNIRNHNKICEPYIQLVTNKRDVYTGIKLSEIWRYFRYTWSIPYKTMPGRNLFYLVRDAAQECHPIIGIFALGNSVLNLKVRDDDLGWTVDAIKRNMERKTKISICKQALSETAGKTVNAKICMPIESKQEYEQRICEYADEIIPLLKKNISNAIKDLYVKDLGYYRQTKYPKDELIKDLTSIAEESARLSINNKNNKTNPNWEDEAKTNLFKRKRSAELAKLLTAQKVFNNAAGNNNKEKLQSLLSKEEGRKAINTALIANRKCKIGSNMMEIIVCGSIPPYNELLGGKLISMLACSPTVIRDYTKKYSRQTSEIASRMKGKKVIRDSHLVYLGTTSLYSIGSSQYNRINVPMSTGNGICYRKMGITEGFGTVFFSKDTTNAISRLLELVDGGKKINNVFGEGTSPRFRMISRGLNTLGIKAEAFLRHYSPRIVYSINLANNTREFLMGIDDAVDYGYELKDEAAVQSLTQEIIDFWYNRWLSKRLTTVDIEKRLSDFNPSDIMLGGI